MNLSIYCESVRSDKRGSANKITDISRLPLALVYSATIRSPIHPLNFPVIKLIAMVERRQVS